MVHGRNDSSPEIYDDPFAVIDRMREAFKDIPPVEIERDVVAIIREMRNENEAARRAEEQDLTERRSAERDSGTDQSNPR